MFPSAYCKVKTSVHPCCQIRYKVKWYMSVIQLLPTVYYYNYNSSMFIDNIRIMLKVFHFVREVPTHFSFLCIKSIGTI